MFPGCLEAEISESFKGTIQHGTFGPARPEIEAATGKNFFIKFTLAPIKVLSTGKKCYDIEMVMWAGQMTTHAVISDDGKVMWMWGFFNDKLDEMIWLDEDEVQKLIESGDSKFNLPCHYPLTPSNQGKLIWISGPPGAGKSTTCQMMSREKVGFVYFEADCVINHSNPYIPSDVPNPTMHMFMQNHIKVLTTLILIRATYPTYFRFRCK